MLFTFLRILSIWLKLSAVAVTLCSFSWGSLGKSVRHMQNRRTKISAVLLAYVQFFRTVFRLTGLQKQRLKDLGRVVVERDCDAHRSNKLNQHRDALLSAPWSRRCEVFSHSWLAALSVGFSFSLGSQAWGSKPPMH